MKIGRTFSFIILLAIALSSVGFTSLSWYCPMEEADKAVCGSCATEKQGQPNCEDDDCCQKHAELMKLQPDLSAAVKLQPNLDSPEAGILVQLPEESLNPTRVWTYSPDFARARPNRIACEHVVLRI